MQKKVLVFIGLCAINLCIGEAQAVNNVSYPIIKSEMTDPPQGYEKIELRGTLMLNIGPNAIEAGASDDAVYISFAQSFGNVNISIYNGVGGLVYSTVVNTNVQQTVIIPFASVASGTYTVELTNANGYADGEFNKD